MQIPLVIGDSDFNYDSIILNLNKIRHFNFINDDKKFIDKKNKAVWRGDGENSEARQELLEIKLSKQNDL